MKATNARQGPKLDSLEAIIKQQAKPDEEAQYLGF